MFEGDSRTLSCQVNLRMNAIELAQLALNSADAGSAGHAAHGHIDDDSAILVLFCGL